MSDITKSGGGGGGQTLSHFFDMDLGGGWGGELLELGSGFEPTALMMTVWGSFFVVHGVHKNNRNTAFSGET